MTVLSRGLRILLVSTPVGPLGSGQGGGVELTILNIGKELLRRGHQVRILAPAGSQVTGLALDAVDGAPQAYAQYLGREAPILMPPNPVLGALWETARSRQDEFDIIINLAYDWLPLYLTPFFRTPVCHLISMGSLTDAMDAAIQALLRTHPERLAVHTRAQAATFQGGEALRVLYNGLDIDQYPFSPSATPRLAWVGRIAPEKGLEDAVAVAQTLQLPLAICGTVQDEDYWASVRRAFPTAPLHYHGFLSTNDLARVLGTSMALLMTPKWTEALGNVVLESLACGTPVIAYRRGGPAEILEDGLTGWLVEPDSLPDLIAAVQSATSLNRAACRAVAARSYSLQALGDRVEAWFTAILAGTHPLAARHGL